MIFVDSDKLDGVYSGDKRIDRLFTSKKIVAARIKYTGTWTVMKINGVFSSNEIDSVFKSDKRDGNLDSDNNSREELRQR